MSTEPRPVDAATYARTVERVVENVARVVHADVETLQLVALGFLIAGRAGDQIVPGVTDVGLGLLWVAALLTLYTGWDYMKAGLKHVVDE